MINTNEKYYAYHTHKHTTYAYVCMYQTAGNIILWNLSTDTLRIVIHSDYGKPNHTGPKSGEGTCIDYLSNIVQLEDKNIKIPIV